MFVALRNDPHHHLGLGDIRITVAQQDLILDAITDSLPPAEGAETCNCGIPTPDSDRECCTICGRLIYEDETIRRPVAEGAEEMLKAVFNEIWDAPVPDDVFENPDYRMSFADAKIVAEKFATLHAQKIADKMVSEKLRNEYERGIEDGKIINEHGSVSYFE